MKKGFNKSDLPAPIKDEFKSDDVSIMPPLSVLAFPNQMGGMNLLINALGNDGRVYSWDGPTKSWKVQK